MAEGINIFTPGVCCGGKCAISFSGWSEDIGDLPATLDETIEGTFTGNGSEAYVLELTFQGEISGTIAGVPISIVLNGNQEEGTLTVDGVSTHFYAIDDGLAQQHDRYTMYIHVTPSWLLVTVRAYDLALDNGNTPVEGTATLTASYADPNPDKNAITLDQSPQTTLVSMTYESVTVVYDADDNFVEQCNPVTYPVRCPGYLVEKTWRMAFVGTKEMQLTSPQLVVVNETPTYGPIPDVLDHNLNPIGPPQWFSVEYDDIEQHCIARGSVEKSGVDQKPLSFNGDVRVSLDVPQHTHADRYPMPRWMYSMRAEYLVRRFNQPNPTLIFGTGGTNNDNPLPINSLHLGVADTIPGAGIFSYFNDQGEPLNSLGWPQDHTVGFDFGLTV